MSNPQALYRPDDPQLVGRIVTFEGAKVSCDGKAIACDRTTRTTRVVTAGTLIRRLFEDGRNPAHPRVARPPDFGLKLASTTPVRSVVFRCSSPQARGAAWAGATIFPVGRGRQALSLIQDHLLILEPVDGPIRAGFDCSKATTTVERTICGDRVLAGWDRSVAAAYRLASADQADQRAWLKKRDRCGSDKECLQDAMSLRTDDLMS